MCFAPKIMFNGKFGGGVKEWLRAGGNEQSLKKQLAEGKAKLIPCGQCMACRKQHAQNWAARCQNESTYWEYTYFITLTYDEEHLPVIDKNTGELYRGFRHPLDYYNQGKRYENSTLLISDMQKFLKRLRQHAHRHGLYEDEERGCKVFYCGEYGSKTSRAHYHLLLYGVKIPDLKVLKRMKGVEYDISETISNLWGMGNIIIGQLNFKTCSYVAKYVMKKYSGPDKMQVYKEAGRTPEFVQMSRRPGIGKKYWEEHRKDIYKYDSVLVGEGKTVKPPKYYDLNEDDKRLEEEEGVNIKEVRDIEKCRGTFEKGLPKMHSHSMQMLKNERSRRAIESLLERLKKTSVSLLEYMEIQEGAWKEKNRRSIRREGNMIDC